MCAKIKEFFMGDRSPAEKVMIILCCISIGVIKGFLLTPIKGGIHCDNDNGDRYFLDSEDYAFDNDDK